MRYRFIQSDKSLPVNCHTLVGQELSGIDARTVMKRTSHDDLESILRYLAPAESAETQSKVNAIVWTK